MTTKVTATERQAHKCTDRHGGTHEHKNTANRIPTGLADYRDSTSTATSKMATITITATTTTPLPPLSPQSIRTKAAITVGRNHPLGVL